MRIERWGDSLAVRLPARLVEDLGLKEGDEVNVQVARANTPDTARGLTQKELVEDLRKYRGLLPADFKFDRDEANSR
jgi:antitoxin MazE